MFLLGVHMECSRCYLQKYVWSAPDVTFRSTYGVLHMQLPGGHMEYSICHFQKYIWSTPYVAFLSTYGVLQMLLPEEHVEYSRYCFYKYIWSIPRVKRPGGQVVGGREVAYPNGLILAPLIGQPPSPFQKISAAWTYLSFVMSEHCSIGH